ncbi:HAD family hydrolase [Alphaproteobacteria bacterium]|jgi:D-glycero-D-manno-heptose 1,7-bisphosphate phosphatase|nr:HAD family hydrolase [Alphaproteobacteria bacterium]
MKTIFLDRDGVINKDFGYVNKWDDFELINGALEALQILTTNKFNIIIVTNQAGIAKGFYTENDFKKLTNQFENFCLNNNIKILHTFYCPHHKDGVIKKYAIDCKSRKPNSGMFFKAAKLYNIDLEKAIMVGDNDTDIAASKGAGIKTNYLIKSNSTKEDLNNKVTFSIRENLLSIINEICNDIK